jgi:hypothetical protein
VGDPFANVPAGYFFNPAAFAPPALGSTITKPVLGNLGGGAGVMSYPHVTNLDATMAKFFPLMNVGQMHLNRRQADRRNGIPDCDAGVGIGGRVNNDPIVSRPSLLNPGDQFTLAI